MMQKYWNLTNMVDFVLLGFFDFTGISSYLHFSATLTVQTQIRPTACYEREDLRLTDLAINCTRVFFLGEKFSSLTLPWME